MTRWHDYKTNRQHTVVGNLWIQSSVYSPQLGNKRDIFVWLPDDYDTSLNSYPVMYMHDGQNLFDAHTSYSGEWHVDETMQLLSREGYRAIIVGISNNKARMVEYGPYDEPRFTGRSGSKADAYLRFITDTLKPMIDRDFRTLQDRKHTGIAGSSMGGLISLYGFITRNDVFGFCGAFSPSYWYGKGGLFKTIVESGYTSGKLYLDVGTREGQKSTGTRNPYVEGMQSIRGALVEKGYKPDQTLCYVVDEGGQHNEAAWSRRLPEALRFLLPR